MEVPAKAPSPATPGTPRTRGRVCLFPRAKSLPGPIPPVAPGTPTREKSSRFSDYRDVPLVVQATGRVAHTAQRAVSSTYRDSRIDFDRREQSISRHEWKSRGDP